MNQKIKKEIDELRKKIENWNYEYYVLDNPSVSDAIYDIEMQRLKNLETQYPEFKTKNSPTNRVGGYVSEKFEKKKHLHPMLSLDNAFNETDLAKFFEDTLKISNNPEFVIEPKIDGLSISLVYINSKLEYALTRGDGVYGEDVTSNIYTIKSIPLFIPKEYQDKVIEIRGEVYLKKDDFIKINNSLDEKQKKFSNPRNAAAGSLRNLDSSICASRNLQAYFYYSPNVDELNISSQYEFITWLKQNKFPVSNEIKLVKSFDAIIKEIDNLCKKREELNYQIDGIVIKTNQYKYYDDIGYTSKFPKWAIAYKFPAEIGLTKIKDIFADVGRTGKITYVADLEPISLDGSIISKVSLNNADYIASKDIRINDYAYIYKAGDVIPYLDFVDLNRRESNSNKFKEILNCPCCNHKLVRINNDVDQRCINKNCNQQLIKKISYFCERDCMNIQGLSISNITKLFNNNIIKYPIDLYYLKDKKNEIINLDILIKEKSFNNLISAIELSKNNSLEKFINALSIRYLGKNSSKILAKFFKSIDNLMNSSLEELLSIFEIGNKTANEVYAFFQDLENKKMIQEFKNIGINLDYKSEFIIDENSDNINTKFYNKKFVITGSFDISRDIIKNIIEEVYSSKVVNTVSKNVDFVISGFKPGSKLIKAKELNINIIENLDELNISKYLK